MEVHQNFSFIVLLSVLCLLCTLAFGQTNPNYLFNPSIAVNTNAATDSGFDYEAQMASDGQGTWVAVWKTDDDLGQTVGDDFDIVYSVSRNNGSSWSSIAPLNSNATEDGEDDENPRLATDGKGNWVVVWESDEQLDPGDHFRSPDIFYSYSSDNAETWSPPAYLSPILSTGPRNHNPFVATDGDQMWLCAWDSTNSLNDLYGGDEDILLSHSLTQGKIWSRPAPLNMNAATDVAQDQFPHLATDGRNTWMAVWATRKGETGNDDDIAISRSTTNGGGWSFPSFVNAQPTEDSGHDSFPQVATDGQGHWVIVWESYDSLEGVIGTDPDILSARSLDNGEHWFGWSAVNSTARSDNGARFSDRRPTIASDGRNTWLACWESNNWLDNTVGTDDDILISKSLDYGVTWSDTEPLNQNMEEDSGDDNWPLLVSTGFNAWAVVWVSKDKLGGSLGNDSDRDVFFARSRFSSVKDEQALLGFLEDWSSGAGDLNEDGEVDYEDVFFFSQIWQQ